MSAPSARLILQALLALKISIVLFSPLAAGILRIIIEEGALYFRDPPCCDPEPLLDFLSRKYCVGESKHP